MRAVALSSTLQSVMDAAGRSVSSTAARANRGAGEAFEHAFADLLSDTVQALVLREVIDEIDGGVPGFGEVCDVRWQWLGGGRKAADFFVTVKATERTVTYPLNLKTAAEGAETGWSFATAAQTVARVALGRDVLETSSVDVDEVALRWMAGEKRLRGGADYFLLVATQGRSGTLVRARAQGLLSTVRFADGRYQLAIRRQWHRGQDVEYVKSELLLPDDFDVNHGLAEALLPQPPRRYTQAALQVAEARAGGAQKADLRELARGYLAA